jgi:hypothetical protein
MIQTHLTLYTEQGVVGAVLAELPAPNLLLHTRSYWFIITNLFG